MVTREVQQQYAPDMNYCFLVILPLNMTVLGQL